MAGADESESEESWFRFADAAGSEFDFEGFFGRDFVVVFWEGFWKGVKLCMKDFYANFWSDTLLPYQSFCHLRRYTTPFSK